MYTYGMISILLAFVSLPLPACLHILLNVLSYRRIPSNVHLTAASLTILEKEVATHSSILAWRIAWTEEPGRLQSLGPKSRYNLATKPHTTRFNHIHPEEERIPWLHILHMYGYSSEATLSIPIPYPCLIHMEGDPFHSHPSSLLRVYLQNPCWQGFCTWLMGLPRIILAIPRSFLCIDLEPRQVDSWGEKVIPGERNRKKTAKVKGCVELTF